MGTCSKYCSLLLVLLPFNSHSTDLSQDGYVPLDTLNLPVLEIVVEHPPYADFCHRNPIECDLKGNSTFIFNTEMLSEVRKTNAAINKEIKFVLDKDQYNKEEYWNMPLSGQGDCEDIAIMKRHKLCALGLPGAALRLALVFHRKLLSSHCILTLETTLGTFVLDSFTDEINLWHQTPYNFELRERVDGSWERFDQTFWKYEH